jgi:L,D-transpeptidase ErfK/SrfK
MPAIISSWPTGCGRSGAKPAFRRAAAGALAALILGSAAALAAGGPRVSDGVDIIGATLFYVTSEEDTLLDIARDNDVGYVEIRAANPGIDPWLPGAGRRITVPTAHILPAARRQGIVINLAELRLYYFPAKDGDIRSFPIGIGGEGKETPLGRTEIARKAAHPSWYPTKSERKEDPTLPTVVPPGPDNPMGDLAIYLAWKGYAIHGTNKPYSIGRRDSHGCIRMLPEDVEVLFKLVGPGTPVTVVDQPVKLGWSGGELFLEVHPTQSDVDEIEASGTPSTLVVPDVETMVLEAAKGAADRVDWYKVGLTAQQRTGVPMAITRLPRRTVD